MCASLHPAVRIPNDVSIGSAIFAQVTAESPYTLQWAAPYPLKSAALREGPGPHFIRSSLGPPESTTQTAYQSVQQFLQGS